MSDSVQPHRRQPTRLPCPWDSPGKSTDWGAKEIPSLSHSVVFLYFFALIAEEGFLISSCYSLKLRIQMLISFLFSFAFRFFSFSFSLLFLRPPQTTIFPFCISFSWEWSKSLPPAQYHKPPSIVLQAFCLSDLVP